MMHRYKVEIVGALIGSIGKPDAEKRTYTVAGMDREQGKDQAMKHAWHELQHVRVVSVEELK